MTAESATRYDRRRSSSLGRQPVISLELAMHSSARRCSTGSRTANRTADAAVAGQLADFVKQSRSLFPPHMRFGARPWHVSKESMAALRRVQDGLATLSPAIDEPMPWLVVMSAPASSLPNLHISLAPLAGCDFHLHLFDVNKASDARFRSLVDRASFVQTTSVTVFSCVLSCELDRLQT
jgi:hypothetical protein